MNIEFEASMKKNNYDVVIVGSGAAACVLALQLSQSGKKVLILERTSGVARNGADIIKPPALRILERANILPVLYSRQARKRTELDVFHDGVKVQAVDYGDDYYLISPHRILLTALKDRLVRSPGVKMVFNTSIASIERRGDEIVSATTTSGDVITASIFVGADGARSMMRDLASIDSHAEIYPQKLYYRVCPVQPSVEERNRLYLGSRGELAYFYPLTGKECAVVLGFEPDQGESLITANDWSLQQTLRRFVSCSEDIVRELPSLRNFMGRPVYASHVASYGRGNIVLLGDALHTVHPITGQGMNLSIEDADCLHDCIINHLDSAEDLSSMIQKYESLRMPVNEQIVSYGDRLIRSLGSTETFQAALDSRLQAAARAS